MRRLCWRSKTDRRAEVACRMPICVCAASNVFTLAVNAVPPQNTHELHRKRLLRASSSADHTTSQSHMQALTLRSSSQTPTHCAHMPQQVRCALLVLCI